MRRALRFAPVLVTAFALCGSGDPSTATWHLTYTMTGALQGDRAIAGATVPDAPPPEFGVDPHDSGDSWPDGRVYCTSAVDSNGTKLLVVSATANRGQAPTRGFYVEVLNFQGIGDYGIDASGSGTKTGGAWVFDHGNLQDCQHVNIDAGCFQATSGCTVHVDAWNLDDRPEHVVAGGPPGVQWGSAHGTVHCDALVNAYDGASVTLDGEFSCRASDWTNAGSDVPSGG